MIDAAWMWIGVGRELARGLPRSAADLRDMIALAGASARGGFGGLINGLAALCRRLPQVRQLSRAWETYRPGTFRRTILVLRATPDGAAPADDDALLGTISRHVTKPCLCQGIQGAHMTLLGHKSVAILAAAIVDGLHHIDQGENAERLVSDLNSGAAA
jgi:hypothetical protein